MTLGGSYRNGFKCFKLKQKDLVLLTMRNTYLLCIPMRAIILIILSIFTISSTLSAATYVNTSGFTQDILKTSGRTHSYSGRSLSPYAYLAFADLYRADLTGADLHHTLLYGAVLARADLSGANLSGAILYGANLFCAKLNGANLYRADLENATLNGADLIGADLIGADLGNATLNGANLYGADLIGADFYSAWLNSANFSHADLSNVSNVHTASWRNSNLYGATLPDGFDQAWFESEGAVFVVPEPSSYALLLGGLALGLIALRRR
jgi:uncharacterized protein YjbI with pentapeptide repeats